MYITTDEPVRTIRTAHDNGNRVLVFGGESHEFDASRQEEDTKTAHQILIDDVRNRYDVDKILYRWMADDYMPYDRMPYIGPHPDCPTVYVMTGYRAWGLAWTMTGAHMIASYINEAPLDWATYFSLDRLKQPVRVSDKNTNL